MSHALPETLPAPVRRSLDRWHEMVASGDFEKLAEITHPDALFRSPVAHTPYKSAMALCVAINAVSKVFENFVYTRTFASKDGFDVVLEFAARVTGRDLKGADFIKFNEAGQIVEFEVMVRPLSGLMALAEEMGKRVGAELTTMKQG